MGPPNAMEAVLRHDRRLIAFGLVAITIVAWVYIIHLARKMEAMETYASMAMVLSPTQQWGPTEITMLFIMWVVMMIAMMTPSAAPMILLFASIYRRRREQERPFVPTGVFVAGYLLAWTAFSAVATIAQWQLHEAALLTPMMVGTSPLAGGALLIAAGIFQWLPLKDACLKQCRSPLAFITTEWREGRIGALMMGLKHGAFCTGCCWALMMLLFVGGVMNLLWIAALATFVLIEKVAPAGEAIARTSGVVLAVLGIWIALNP